MNWYLNVMKNHYADFKSRARRQEYWMFNLVNLIIYAVLLFLGVATESDLMAVVLILYYIAILVPSLSITVRRLHDIGKSGWMFLINFVPFVGGIILLIFLCLDSEPHDNQYGPNPKNIHISNTQPTSKNDHAQSSSENEMFCGHCGEKTPVTNFCVKCGGKL
jgi:uncharacterized membrane protein YhaH (DUF805 family)